MMTRKPARVLLLKDARQKLAGPSPAPRPQRRLIDFIPLRLTAVSLLGVVAIYLGVLPSPDLAPSKLMVDASGLIDRSTTGSVSPDAEPIRAKFSICASATRINCVVDGDTFWYGGVKYRISDINTPEISQPACERERQLARQAQVALLQTLNGRGLTLEQQEWRDTDKYGRKLRVVMQDGHSIGDALIARGLAHRWEGHKLNWCG
ncbi:nuclease [Rhizobium wuzhouense]|uniref:Nuclease n=2 Tax=Rhizobium wuzhouense TaxID=1986026 RepID=A0ABX5NN60_9HYPH|nr:nuclease [Rhizobium wuzhouense]